MTLREVQDIRDLVDLVELTDVQFYEIWGKRRQQEAHDEDEAAAESAQDGQAETNPVQILINEDPESIVVRAIMSLEAPDAEYRIDAAIMYSMHEPCVVDSALRVEFAEKVGVMALFPFLREAMFSTAARMRLEAPVLGIVRAGQIRLTENRHSEPEAASEP